MLTERKREREKERKREKKREQIKKVLSVQISINRYKGRTDSNSPTEPNEAVCVATILL